MSISFRNALNEQLKDPVLKKEVESLETEFSMIRALIASRKEKEIRQPNHTDHDHRMK